MPSLHQLHGTYPADRDGWGQALIQVIAPATRAAARGPARQPVHATNHDRGGSWFGLVTRPLWGLAAHAAQHGEARLQWDEVRGALSAAVDPGHPWYIGEPVPYDQRIVESAAVGYALAVAPHELWEPLTGAQRDHLSAWLSTAAAAQPADNNWHFFPVLAATGLRAVGVPIDETLVNAHLDRLETFALDDGWYADGANTRGRSAPRDYYVPFGFHFYGLLLASLKAVDHGRAARYVGRAATFAQQFQHWFADDGAALPFGRSLGYRFAQGSFWSALAATDTAVVPWPTVRGLAERHLQWWWTQPIAHDDGLFSVGYAYPNTGVVEQYMAGGAPYWSTKFFAALAAPADHPFWTSTPAPPVQQESISVQPTPSMILAKDAHGDVTALAGQNPPLWNARGGQAKYTKFAYSTLAAFSVPTGGSDLDSGGFDSTLALSEDGEHWRTRAVGECEVDGDSLIISWQPWPDVSIETRLTHRDGGGHERRHEIVTGRPLYTVEGGFCVPWLAQRWEIPDTYAGPGEAWASASGIISVVLDYPSADSGPGRRGEIIEPMPGSNLLHPRTVLPVLHTELPPGSHQLTCHVRISRKRPEY